MIAAVRDGQWYWGLGDPDLGAVLVTGLYFLTAMICLLVARRLSLHAVPLIRPAATFSPGIEGEGTGAVSAPSSGLRPPSPPVSGEKGLGEGRFWLVLAGMLFALGVNKQADFQSLLTLYGRDILHQAGLHDVRRPIQVAFIAGVALVAVVSVALCLWMVRRWSWPCRFAAVGLGIQAAFVVVRAASFHHVDSLLRLRLGDLKINLLLESIGLFVILWSGIAWWAKARADE
jgi:dipeptide/tripeptide permease